MRDTHVTQVVSGTRRVYAVAPDPLREIDAWLDHFRRCREPHLDALATELARGKREYRLQEEAADD